MISEKEESVFKCTMKIIGVGVEGICGLKVILFSPLILTVNVRNGIMKMLKERCKLKWSTGAMHLQIEQGRNKEGLQIA